jgi:hypothetical protein
VPLEEKLGAALLCQRVWADNAVSVTVTFDGRSQAGRLARGIQRATGRLKSLSALPFGGAGYGLMPYESLTRQEYDRRRQRLLPIDWKPLYADGDDGDGDSGCTTDRCALPA